MLSILCLVFFAVCGVWAAWCWLPRLGSVMRTYVGASVGLLMLLWLPALWAMAVRFSLLAHGLSALTALLLCAGAWLTRDRRERVRLGERDRAQLKLLLLVALPLTVLGGYLQYTHSIRPAADGSLHVGQSTYGDLQLHLAVTTSAVNAQFPLQNSLMLGASMAYPYLSDTFATSMYLLGLPLSTAMALTGTVMLALVFTGYCLLCAQLCRRRGAAWLAVCLLFLNGGLGFFYTLSGTIENGVTTTAWDNLREVMEGYYKTPTNQPDPNNLRWSNILCDMLIPQRGILGGWTMLLPCLNLLLPPLAKKENPSTRALVLLGLMAGGLPLLHTHSFLALALASAGVCAWCVWHAERGRRWDALRPFVLYAGLTAALALPQLILFTFPQATGSDHFLRFQFNWCNNRGGNGLIDPYFWFYLKNIGLPYLLILLALLRRRPQEPEERGWVDQRRMIALGAFCIYAVAELVLFQPNEYDNNKLLYVWFLLCLPMAADYACEAYEKLRGLAGRRAIAALFLATCFLSAGLTVARECVSDYQAYDASDVAAGEFVKENTPEHSVFLTGTEHLNPVVSLAGRTIVCGSDLYLYYHGFSTGGRKAELSAFYEDPASNLAVLEKYGVEYVYVSDYERSSYAVDDAALDRLFTRVYSDGVHAIYQVEGDPAMDVNADG